MAKPGPKPSGNIRLQIVMNPETYKALKELAAATGHSAGGWAGTMLNNAVPVMRSITEAARVAAAEPQKAAKIIDDSIRATQVDLAQVGMFRQKLVKPVGKSRPDDD